MVLSLPPHIDPARYDSVKILGVAFLLICSTCYFHLRLLSISTSKKMPKVFALIMWLLFKIKSICNFAFLWRDKCTSWYLIGSNFEACYLAQAIHNICVFFSNWQFCKIRGLVASRKTSLMNSPAVTFLLVVQHILIKSAL